MCNMAGQTAGFGSGVAGGRGVEGLFGETRLGQETWEPPLEIFSLLSDSSLPCHYVPPSGCEHAQFSPSKTNLFLTPLACS